MHDGFEKIYFNNSVTENTELSCINSTMFNDLHFQNEIEHEMALWLPFGLHPVIIRNLYLLGFKAPTEIQNLTLTAALLKQSDIMGAAETGSGKTLAYGLAVLNDLLYFMESSLKEQETRLLSLILAPTRELTQQVYNHLTSVMKGTSLRMMLIVGGLAKEKQARLLSRKPHIIVATPGRLWEFIDSSEPHVSDLTGLRHLVIDEADRMATPGCYKELAFILNRLPVNKLGNVKKFSLDNYSQKHKKLKAEVDYCPSTGSYERRTYLFSATLTRESTKIRYKSMNKVEGVVSTLESVKKLINLRPNCEVIDLSSGLGVALALSEAKITCLKEEKDIYLYYLHLKHPGRTLVFCNSIDCLKHVSSLMKVLKIVTYPLHANMPQRQRLKNLDRFKRCQTCLLVATDVAARGLDIKGVEHVIHYQLPRSTELYIHRSGRTARANSEGLSLMLISPEEIPKYKMICRELKKDSDYEEFPVDSSYFPLVQKRIKIARKLETLLFTFQKKQKEKFWLQKAAKDLEHDINDEDSEESLVKNNYEVQKFELQSKLDTLLEKPLVPPHVARHRHNYQLLVDSNLSKDSEVSAVEIVKKKINSRTHKILNCV
ncbi:ATP-dependent RNA helicase DDX24-like [Zophobas morio]|uniref:ATP-dependent RNA helicase DDX24-like n=1 Tax=Zophobas morio TaxID=2755281 RepID=UPI0030829CC7